MAQEIAAFITGLLIFNAVPHLVQGICGKKHMTPFSPKSSAWTNVVWGWINLVAGVIVGAIFQCCQGGLTVWIAFGAGGFAVSLYLSLFWSNPDARLPWHPSK